MDRLDTQIKERVLSRFVWVLSGYCLGVVWVLSGFCLGLVWVLSGAIKNSCQYHQDGKVNIWRQAQVSNDRRWEAVQPYKIQWMFYLANDQLLKHVVSRQEKQGCMNPNPLEPRCKVEAQTRNIAPYQQTIQLSGVPQKHLFRSSWWGPITQVINSHTTVKTQLWG